jgi:hypothetical protein
MKPLQQPVAPQGHRVESGCRLGGAPAAERPSVRRTPIQLAEGGSSGALGLGRSKIISTEIAADTMA